MNLGKSLFALALALAALFILSALVAYFAFPIRPPHIDNPDLRMAMTPEEMTTSQNPNGFQMLVSYTDNGFAPAVMHMRVGETIRFTNNASRPLWVASSILDGGSLYPGIFNGCSSSAFDSCRALNPGEYWEFTLGLTGDWGFANKLNAEERGIVHVAK